MFFHFFALWGFCICVITFEPITFQTCSAPQNDRLNFKFVKDIYVIDKKMARNGRKTDIQTSSKFWATCFNYLFYFQKNNYHVWVGRPSLDELRSPRNSFDFCTAIVCNLRMQMYLKRTFIFKSYDLTSFFSSNFNSWQIQ